ncbi:MAG: hypothetical protein QXF45_01095 [Candidatus Caldarchaeum sp.]
MKVWVAGVGEIPCKQSYEGIDFREMLFQAAQNAYRDAGISRSDIDGIVASGFDFFEGISITDSYTPDQVGGRLKFNTSVTNDSLNAFIHACMLLKTGEFRTLAVSVFSKPSEIPNYAEVVLNSWDPHLVRPLLMHHGVAAGLDAQAFLNRVGGNLHDFSLVASKNHGNALKNESAAYGMQVSPYALDRSDLYAEPLREGHVARLCDYAAVVVLTNDSSLGKVLVKGFGFSSGLSTTDFSAREFGTASWVRPAVKQVEKMADSLRFDFVEVSEPFASSELMFLDGLGVFREPVVRLLRRGDFDSGCAVPVNSSGGCLGMGYPLNAAGLQRVVQAVKQLRQGGFRSCLVGSFDGEVVDGGAVVLLESEA